MKASQLTHLGVPSGEPMRRAFEAIRLSRAARLKPAAIRKMLKKVVGQPGAYTGDPIFGALAREIVGRHRKKRPGFVPREKPAPWIQWGDDLEPTAVQQLVNACQLPVSVRGALMPDAHQGYGLPIGGVLAVKDAVIPYAVGVDIGCRMKLSVYDLPVETLKKDPETLKAAIETETRFGIGASFKKKRRSHEVLDEDWSVSPVTDEFKDRAWAQLGTSGSGNHFVEFGIFEAADKNEFGLEPGRYLALLSHSGSRGTGAKVAAHYSRIAMALRELPRELTHLAWLDLDSADGQEYWAAMELMGHYAAANHACIHRHIREFIGAEVLLDIENHHNFAWKEEHDGQTVIVHRKGATPAAEGDIGIIPGSMASSTYIVRGKGNPDSLNSAAHGAGRVMSRTKAKKTFRWSQVRDYLNRQGVTLISAGLDEAPMVYKNIDKVMAAQADLVESLATFQPKLVKMAPPGERPED